MPLPIALALDDLSTSRSVSVVARDCKIQPNVAVLHITTKRRGTMLHGHSRACGEELCRTLAGAQQPVLAGTFLHLRVRSTPNVVSS